MTLVQQRSASCRSCARHRASLESCGLLTRSLLARLLLVVKALTRQASTPAGEKVESLLSSPC
jgi:hypothetical protein